MLTVKDGNNQLVTLTGLGTQKTVKGVTGYDITGVRGLKALLDNHAIIASNNEATTENWQIIITFINLDVNQNDNTGKEITAELVIKKDTLDVGYTGLAYRNNLSLLANNVSVTPVDSIYCAVNEPDAFCYDYDTELEYLSHESCEQDNIEHGLSEEYTCLPFSTVYCLVSGNNNSCLEHLFFTTELDCENYHSGEGYECIATSVSSLNLGGIGNYSNSLNGFLATNYTIYCPVDESNDYDGCEDNWYYLKEEWCEEDVDTSLYTCTEGSIPKKVYLKHEVFEDTVENTEVCLHYNNGEFCMEPNYWVNDDNNLNNQNRFDSVPVVVFLTNDIVEPPTVTKMKNEMYTAFGLYPNHCDFVSTYAYCEMDNDGLYKCKAYSDGRVECLDPISTCQVFGDGMSRCIFD